MPSDTNARVIRFGVYEADVRSGELRKHAIRLRLQDQPFQVLCMLLERPGELVTREELRQRLWPADTFVDFDHGLNTAVNKLRDVLGDSAANPRFIETLARRGYRFVGPAPVVVKESSVATGQSSASASANASTEETVENQTGLKPEQLPDSPARTDAAVNQERPSAAIAAEAPGATAASDGRLPTAPRAAVRTLFGLAQAMYLTFYIVALAELHEVYRLAAELVEGGGRAAETAALITASAGIAVRLYLLTAVIFDYQPLGWKFKRIFFLILILDFAWALSPYLLMPWIGTGLATAACAALLYLPFSQRTLIRMAYGP